MKGLLEKVDLFAHKINFNYEKKLLYHSFFGIGLTISLYCVMVWFVYYFSKDFIKQINPKVLFTETEFQDYIYITPQHITESGKFVLKIFSNSTINKLETYGNKTNISANKIGYFYFYKYNPSDEVKYPLSIPFSFKSSKCNYKNKLYFCYTLECDFAVNSTSALKLKKNILQEFEIRINKRETIEFGFYFDPDFEKIFYSNSIIDVSFHFSSYLFNNIINVNSENFFSSYSDLFLLFPKLNKEKRIFEYDLTTANYGTITLIDDRGFIFSHPQNKTTIKKNYDSTRSLSTKDIVLYRIEIDPLMKIYTRIYRKLPNVFADLGGLMSSLILMGNIIIVEFNKKKFDYDLINKVFRIEKNEEEQRINNKAKIIDKQINSKNVLNILSINQMNSSRLLIGNSFKNDFLPDIKNKMRKNPLYANNITEKIFDLQIDKGEEKDSTSVHNLKKSYSSIKLEMMHKNGKLKTAINAIAKSNQQRGQGEALHNIEMFNENFSKGKLFSKPLKYSKFEFFKSFLFCTKLKGEPLLEKEKLFESAQDQIYECMDIITYIQLFEKLEKLISIMLNENQALSFNFVRNKNISDLNNSKVIDKENIRKVIEYFKGNIRDSKMSLIDERLLNTFYPSFSKLI